MSIFKGGTKTKSLYKANQQIKKMYKGNQLVYSKSRLPSGFQEVEYIDSSTDGTQRIVFPYKREYWNYQTNITVIAENLGTKSTSCFGCENGDNNAIDIQLPKTDNTSVVWSFLRYSKYVTISKKGKCEIINDVGLTTNKGFFNDVQVCQFGQQYTTQWATPQYQLWLFAWDSGRTGNHRYFGGRIYYFKAEQNGVVRYELIPCYRTSDNVIGMYDIINDVFYTNAGSGTFAKGNDV